MDSERVARAVAVAVASSPVARSDDGRRTIGASRAMTPSIDGRGLGLRANTQPRVTTRHDPPPPRTRFAHRARRRHTRARTATTRPSTRAMRAAYRDRGDVASPFRRDARRRRATRGTARRGGATAASAATTARLTREQCVEYVRSGCKPRDRFRIGTEHEKLGYDVATERRMEYPVVKHVLSSLVERYGWTPIDEGENIIGCAKDGQSVTLEPGGQFELSGAPLENLRQTEEEVRWHIETVTALAQERGHKFMGIGFDPQWSVAEVPMMPKGRYKIMRAYMPTKGTRGLDMMFRTCTIQVNLDFEDERDMVRKFRTSLALQPIATALFANSAFVDGRDTGYQSMRSDVWKDTDADRTGTLAWVFEDDFGFEKYCDYVMNVPMYFVYRNGTYVDVSGESWHDFMEGKLPQLPGDTPSIDDWEQHLTTVFPEVRLKRYMEMRGADGGSFEAIMALPALWVGLLYSPKALDAAEKLTSDWTQAERDALRNDVTKDGLSTKFRDGTANDIAKEMIRLAVDGLKERGLGEEVYLDYLQTIVQRGSSNAARMSELNASEWKDDLSKVYEYATFPDVLPTF